MTTTSRLGDFLLPPDEDDVAVSLGARPGATLANGDRLGPWRILGEIGQGGMGRVYRARRDDDAFEKIVALKVIAGAVHTTGATRRFHRERELLARLEHPGITRLLDGGTTAEGLPWLAMEFVAGVPITQYAGDHDLDLAQRMQLAVDVCTAVEYAHGSLVVHCDLKPANILVTSDGHVKLLDFGISRLLDDDGAAPAHTRVRAGTPEYASPEQIRGAPVSTTVDVYALGVLLYELATERQPHDLADLTPFEADRLVCESDPAPPSIAAGDSTRARALRGDLDTVIRRALHRDPARRYASAAALSDDVRRWIEKRPITARPDGFIYRTQMLVRRNPAMTMTTVAAVIALMIAVGATAAGFVQARRAQVHAEVARADTHAVLRWMEDILATSSAYRHGRNISVEEQLDLAARRLDASESIEPAVAAGVHLALARTHVDLMDWHRAEPHLQAALPHLRMVADRSDSDTLVLADALCMHARALTQLGRPGAVDAARRCVALRRSVCGSTHALVAEGTGALGYALWASGDPPDVRAAETHYLAALVMLRDLGLVETRDYARLTMSLGFLYHRNGRPDEAETHYARALALYDSFADTEDLYPFATRGLYARLLIDLDRSAEALALLDRSRADLPEGLHEEKREQLTWWIAQAAWRSGDDELAHREFVDAVVLCADRAARYDAGMRPVANDVILSLHSDPSALATLYDDIAVLLDAVRGPDPNVIQGLAALREFLLPGDS